MKLIDADALWMEFIHRMDYCDDILEIVDEMPEAVVRCGDCVRAYRDEWGFGRYEGCPFYDLYLYGQEPLEENGYCSYGKRRTDETD